VSVTLSIILLLVGFVLLIKGADFMVGGASSLAKRYHVSELAIGLTVVAFGTSAPELVVNVISSAQGKSDVVYGNIIGSNLFNLLLILGISGMITPLVVKSNTVWKEIPYSLFAVILMFILVNDGWVFGREYSQLGFFESGTLLLFFVIFIIYVAKNLKTDHQTEDADIKIMSGVRTTIYILGGLAGLVIGGKLVVDNATTIALSFGMSEKLVALTIVAAGTSLPELATSAIAAYKKKVDIAVGNIIGSNIFNIFLILGISGLVNRLVFDPVMNMDVYILLAATTFLFIAMFTGKYHKLDRWEAVLFFLGFIAYMVYVIVRN
jgi:cation:H+ antiporter